MIRTGTIVIPAITVRLQIGNTIAELAEKRHEPALAEERFDDAHNGQEKSEQKDDGLKQNHNEEPQERQASDRHIDDDERDESDTLGAKEQEGLAGVKAYKIALSSLPEAYEAEEEDIADRSVPALMIGQKYHAR